MSEKQTFSLKYLTLTILLILSGAYWGHALKLIGQSWQYFFQNFEIMFLIHVSASLTLFFLLTLFLLIFIQDWRLKTLSLGLSFLVCGLTWQIQTDLMSAFLFIWLLLLILLSLKSKNEANNRIRFSLAPWKLVQKIFMLGITFCVSLCIYSGYQNFLQEESNTLLIRHEQNFKNNLRQVVLEEGSVEQNTPPQVLETIETRFDEYINKLRDQIREFIEPYKAYFSLLVTVLTFFPLLLIFKIIGLILFIILQIAVTVLKKLTIIKIEKRPEWVEHLVF